MAQVEVSKRLARTQAYEYDMVEKEAKLAVRPGDAFTVETEDALNGLIRSEDRLPVPEVLGPRFRRFELNPCAGPILVEGVKAGDLLVVEIVLCLPPA